MWIAATPADKEAFDTEAAAEARADWWIKSKTAACAVVYAVEMGDA